MPKQPKNKKEDKGKPLSPLGTLAMQSVTALCLFTSHADILAPFQGKAQGALTSWSGIIVHDSLELLASRRFMRPGPCPGMGPIEWGQNANMSSKRRFRTRPSQARSDAIGTTHGLVSTAQLRVVAETGTAGVRIVFFGGF